MVNNQLDLNLLKTFTKVLELGSFTQAARVLKQPKSRISKAISRLEKELNVQLLRRTTRSVSATTAGQSLYLKTYPLIKDMEAELSQLTEQSQKLQGILRLSAPEDFGHTLLGDLITDFNDLYPEINFDVILANDFVDLTKQNIDLAFRIGKLDDSNLIQKKIGNVELILVATPEYLKKYGSPLTKKDLGHHKMLTFIKLDQHIEFDPLGEIIMQADLKTRFACNSFPVLFSLVMKHKGIALIPDFYCREQLLSGMLVRVLPTFSAGRRGIHLIYPPSKSMPLRLRTFIDFASNKLQSHF